MNLKDMRRDYRQGRLEREDLTDQPMELLKQWLEDAVDHGEPEPNAMVLSTVSENGAPSSRVVLLKGNDRNGLVWFTNYNSRKGQELVANPVAALNFHWHGLQRQVCIRGEVEKISTEASKAYYHSRPRGSQLGAWTSPQSKVIPNRAFLDQRLADLQEQYGEDKEIPLPGHWGGFRLSPTWIEFWQGRSSRLHDRFAYQLGEDGNWQVDRLAP